MIGSFEQSGSDDVDDGANDRHDEEETAVDVLGRDKPLDRFEPIIAAMRRGLTH